MAEPLRVIPAELTAHVGVACRMLARRLRRDGLASPGLEQFAALLLAPPGPEPEPAPETAIGRVRRLDAERARRYRARRNHDRDAAGAGPPAA